MSSSDKLTLALSVESVLFATSFNCRCTTACTERINLRRSDVRLLRVQVRSPNIQERGDGVVRHIATLLNASYSATPQLGEHRHPRQHATQWHYRLFDRDVCEETFAEVLAISIATLKKARHYVVLHRTVGTDLSAPPTRVHEMLAATSRQDQREASLRSWLIELAEQTGDVMPDGELVDDMWSATPTDEQRARLAAAAISPDGGAEYRLPFHEKKRVFGLYLVDVSDPYSYGAFVQKWLKVARFVKRAGKHTDGFCHCDKCLDFKRSMISLFIPPDEREAMRRTHLVHIAHQRAQRDEYARIIQRAVLAYNNARLLDRANADEHERRAFASLAAARVLDAAAQPPPLQLPPLTVPESASIVLDCASGQKMGTLPWFGKRPPKAFATRKRLECKAMGIIIHGIWRAMMLYDGSVPHGAAMVIDAIHRALAQLQIK